VTFGFWIKVCCENKVMGILENSLKLFKNGVRLKRKENHLNHHYQNLYLPNLLPPTLNSQENYFLYG